MIESTISKNGQTTLPNAVRKALGVKPGDRVRYVIRDGEVKIIALKPIDRLFGALKYDGPPASPQDMDRAIAEGASEL